MKKIFLTSGLVVCMACPAYADFDANATGEQTGACVEDYLGVTEGSTTLRAIWNAQTFNVTYHKCGTGYGTNAANYTDEGGAEYNSTYTIPAAADVASGVADGYTFIGWSTNSAATVTRTNTTDENTGATIASSTGSLGDNAWTAPDPWNLTSNLDVYAICQANQYTVSYSCGTAAQLQDGADLASGASASQIVTFGESFTSTGACEYEGHTFAGWNCGNDTLPSDGSNWNIANDVSCTATWTTNQIDITWDFDGATSTVTEETTTRCSYGSNVVLPAEPEKTGYDFGGWEVVPQTSQQSGGNNEEPTENPSNNG